MLQYTILMSTHILQEVDSLCDEIFIINKGRIAIAGTEQSITKEKNTETLEQAFFKIINDGEAENEK